MLRKTELEVKKFQSAVKGNLASELQTFTLRPKDIKNSAFEGLNFYAAGHEQKIVDITKNNCGNSLQTKLQITVNLAQKNITQPWGNLRPNAVALLGHIRETSQIKKVETGIYFF